MADNSLQAESVSANPTEFEKLYAAWRYAKGMWDVKSYAPENPTGLPDEQEDALCDATAEALNRFLLHPAETARELAIKLRVFRDEDIVDNWCRGTEIVATLAADAHRLAFGKI